MITIKVVIPVYNAEKWIGKCIMSIVNQTYTNWQCIIINDKSTDNTFEMIKRYIPRSHYKNFIVHNNKTNVGALNNIADGISRVSGDADDVIVLVDGDDWLAHKNVFAILNKAYDNPNTWLTYGNYVTASDGCLLYTSDAADE